MKTIFVITLTSLLFVGQALQAQIIHRYSFDDMTDSVGDKDIVQLHGGATLTGGALVNADNQSAAVRGAQLPNDIFDGRTSVTLEGWFSFHDNNDNQFRRVFYFGGSGNQSIEGGIFGFNNGTPQGDWYQHAFVDYQNNAQNGWSQLRVQHNALGSGREHYLAVTLDDAANTLTIYFGKHTDSGYLFFSNQVTGWTGNMSTIAPIANYLGTASWGNHLNGSVHEYRIYDRALSSAEIQLSLDAGTDTVAIPEPSTLSLLGLAFARFFVRRRVVRKA